jgi:hypothetical protein
MKEETAMPTNEREWLWERVGIKEEERMKIKREEKEKQQHRINRNTR